jgi:predicted RNase H-like HicB family nuclease
VKPKQLFLRCFADISNGQWQAFCLDLDLAAQGETLDEATQKLEAQIREYVFDALAGEDQAYADQLLSRRAPVHLWVRYYWYGVLLKVWHMKNGVKRFKERLPLVPEGNHSFA